MPCDVPGHAQCRVKITSIFLCIKKAVFIQFSLAVLIIHRYSANDYFLKDLLGEWCEGILNTTAGSSGLLGKSKTQNLLIEKVAVLLQKDVSENQVIDLNGLTKV